MTSIITFFKWLFNLLPPTPPENLKAIIRRIKMSNAKIELDWEVSHSRDVIRQDIVVMIQPDGADTPVELVSESLPPNQDKYVVTIPEKTKVYVKIVAYDGTYYSKPMVNQFYIPDVTIPSPPINEGWKILEIDGEEPCY